MEHLTPVLRSDKPRIDADFSIIAFGIRTDDTKRCEVESNGGSPCPNGAAWLGLLPCDHGQPCCPEHKAAAEAWLARGDLHVLTCQKCSTQHRSITWRPL